MRSLADQLAQLQMEVSIFTRRVGAGWPELARTSQIRLWNITEDLLEEADRRAHLLQEPSQQQEQQK